MQGLTVNTLHLPGIQFDTIAIAAQRMTELRTYATLTKMFFFDKNPLS
jgi:hypothetical protein